MRTHFGFGTFFLSFAAVKRLTSIIMLFAVLVTQTEFHQLLKMPVVVLHYLEHSDIDPAISIGEFISIHYFNEAKPDSDHARDMQLPFKAADCDITAVPPVVLPSAYCISFHVSTVREIVPVCYVNEAISSLHVSDIWQPPRRA